LQTKLSSAEVCDGEDRNFEYQHQPFGNRQARVALRGNY
jgi:hypothetical protein